METDQAVRVIRIGLFLALALGLTGCQSTSMYSWGRYQKLVYAMYAKPDKATAELQLQKMEEDLQKARSQNKPLPPGFHAHRGYLYYQLGKPEAAREEFEAEKASFPESAVFMDRLLGNMARK